jgi:non-reducing end alpha-L-arabinofuranosidase
MVKGGTNGFAIKVGDATTGQLATMYNGPRPNGYQPMKKQGAIVLGIGGDNSWSAIGTFFEGVMTQGYSSDAADAAVQANIVAAGYGK